MIEGFTLIELMITLVIISILSIVVVSRFDGKSGYVEYTYQGRFISLARHLQIRAMHHTQAKGFCYQVNIATGTSPWFSSPNLIAPPATLTVLQIPNGSRQIMILQREQTNQKWRMRD